MTAVVGITIKLWCINMQWYHTVLKSNNSFGVSIANSGTNRTTTKSKRKNKRCLLHSFRDNKSNKSLTLSPCRCIHVPNNGFLNTSRQLPRPKREYQVMPPMRQFQQCDGSPGFQLRWEVF